MAGRDIGRSFPMLTSRLAGIGWQRVAQDRSEWHLDCCGGGATSRSCWAGLGWVGAEQDRSEWRLLCEGALHAS
eukprot:358075-Chlamydomonas_euryale.AAC.7